MSQPLDFLHPNYPNHVCKLQKAIYGLKQAPRARFAKLSARLLDLGFSAAKFDPSLFVYRQHSVVIYAWVYVDDIVLISNIVSNITALIDFLSSTFLVKDLGALTYFLGVEVSYLSFGILLSQCKYILTCFNTPTCSLRMIFLLPWLLPHVYP